MSFYKSFTFIFVFALQTCYLGAEIDRSFYQSEQEIDQSWESKESLKERGSEAQHSSLDAISKRLSDQRNFSDSENIRYFSECLRKLSMTSIYQLKERIAVYDQLQSKVVSIPCHAEYFRDEIEKERAALKPNQFRGSYDDKRRLFFEKLSHLPSAESIKVLGGYLSDERDAEKEAGWEPVDLFLIGVEPNSDHAREALKKIGLRNTSFAEPDVGEWPSPTSYSTREEYMRVKFSYLVALREARLKPWLAWYAEVKDGRRTFSFKGQKVEYRFRPDGTWETIDSPNENPTLIRVPCDPPMSFQVTCPSAVAIPGIVGLKAGPTPVKWQLAIKQAAVGITPQVFEFAFSTGSEVVAELVEGVSEFFDGVLEVLDFLLHADSPQLLGLQLHHGNSFRANDRLA
jgi:hypothetical protein